MVIARFPRPRRLRPDRGTDKGEDLGLVQPLQTHVLVDVPGTVVGGIGEVACASDGAEAEGSGRETLGRAVFGKGVEEGGGGAVGGLPMVTEEGGDGA